MSNETDALLRRFRAASEEVSTVVKESQELIASSRYLLTQLRNFETKF